MDECLGKVMKKTAIITGATGAIGKAIARQLAEREFKTILACRNEKKARNAVDEIKKASGNKDVYYEIVDLSLKQSIYDFANRWQGELHVLVNNAAIAPHSRCQTDDGIELQFATNVLGYFWMIEALAKHLHQSAPARVVNVASYWAGDLRLDDLEFNKRSYNNNSAYRQSKQADRMLTVAFADRLNETGITVNACHPGDVNSQLSNDLGFGGYTSADAGAETPVALATGDIGAQQSGSYFEHLREVHCSFAQDRTVVEELFNICSSYLK